MVRKSRESMCLIVRGAKKSDFYFYPQKLTASFQLNSCWHQVFKH